MEKRVVLSNKLYGCMVTLYGVIDTQIVTTFQGSIAPFCVLMMYMRRGSFNGELLYTRTAGSGFSGVLTGVHMTEEDLQVSLLCECTF
jgi:hypothetical protein